MSGKSPVNQDGRAASAGPPIAGCALAQFAFAYSLIAQLGIYLHEGQGQLVIKLSELLGVG